MKAWFKTLIITAIVSAVSLGTPLTSSAQEKDKGKEKGGEKGKGDEKGKGEEKGKGGGFTGKAAAVDKAAKTVKLSGEKGRVLQIVATTKILKDGKPATLDDLKDGDDVYGGYKAGAEGKLEATTLNIGKPPVKKKEEKKDEKKDEKK